MGITTLVNNEQLLNALCPIVVNNGLTGNVTLAKAEQALKAFASILVTEFGSIMLVKRIQPEKSELLIFVSWLSSSNVTAGNLLHELKQASPIVVTDLGIVKLVKDIQIWNAEGPIVVNWLGVSNVFSNVTLDNIGEL